MFWSIFLLEKDCPWNCRWMSQCSSPSYVLWVWVKANSCLDDGDSVRSCVVSHWWPRSGDRLLDFGTWTGFSVHRVHTEWQRPLPSLVRVVVWTSTPFHYISHHVQSFSVRSSWEGRDTPPILSLSPCTLGSSQPTSSFSCHPQLRFWTDTWRLRHVWGLIF
jgi:hypothetical protein